MKSGIKMVKNDTYLCSGKGCNMRDLCHRYSKSTFKKYEGVYSEFIEPPFTLNKDGIWKCEHFIGSENKIEFVSLKDIFTGNMTKRTKK